MHTHPYPSIPPPLCQVKWKGSLPSPAPPLLNDLQDVILTHLGRWHLGSVLIVSQTYQIYTHVTLPFTNRSSLCIHTQIYTPPHPSTLTPTLSSEMNKKFTIPNIAFANTSLSLTQVDDISDLWNLGQRHIKYIYMLLSHPRTAPPHAFIYTPHIYPSTHPTPPHSVEWNEKKVSLPYPASPLWNDFNTRRRSHSLRSQRCHLGFVQAVI